MVGGFDERMGWGGEDVDLGLRLEAAGIRCRSVRHSARVFHLEHERPYASEEQVRRNVELRRQSLSGGQIVTPHGLKRHLDGKG
jgi:GT2 family glycosyltransferase